MLLLASLKIPKDSASPWPEVHGAIAVALRRAVAVGLSRAQHADCRVVEVDVVPGECDRLADPHTGGDQELRERPIDRHARIEVAGDLIEAQVVALDMGGRESLHAGRRVPRELSFPARIVQAGHECSQRVVDRLRRVAPIVHGVRQPGFHSGRGQLGQLDGSEGRQPLASVDLVVAVGSGLQIWPPVS